MIQFHETVMGKKFFEGSVPRLISSINALVETTKDLTNAVNELTALIKEEKVNGNKQGPEN